jgi:hypothetical protein
VRGGGGVDGGFAHGGTNYTTIPLARIRATGARADPAGPRRRRESPTGTPPWRNIRAKASCCWNPPLRSAGRAVRCRVKPVKIPRNSSARRRQPRRAAARNAPTRRCSSTVISLKSRRRSETRPIPRHTNVGRLLRPPDWWRTSMTTRCAVRWSLRFRGRGKARPGGRPQGPPLHCRGGARSAGEVAGRDGMAVSNEQAVAAEAGGREGRPY